MKKFTITQTTLWALGVTAFFLAGVGIPNSYAQPSYISLQDFSTSIETRYNNIDYGNLRNRQQVRAQVNFDINLFNFAKVASYIASGEHFTSAWSDVYDFKSHQPGDLKLHFRQLYLESNWGKTTFPQLRLQAGAIPPIKKTVSATGFKPAGWVDGVRAEMKFHNSVIEFVGGSLGNFDTPNLFKRAFDINYAEIEWSHKVNALWSFEFSYDYLEPHHYARNEINFDFERGPLGQIKSEILYNIDARKVSAGINFIFPFRGIFFHDKFFSLRLAYFYTDALIGARGELADDFYQFGHMAIFRAKLTPWVSVPVELNARAVVGKLLRYDIGFSLKLKNIE